MNNIKRRLALFLTVSILMTTTIISAFAGKDKADLSTSEKVVISFANFCNPGASTYQSEPSDPTYHRVSPTSGKVVRSKMRFVTSDDSSVGSPRHDKNGKIMWVYCVDFGTEAVSYNTRTISNVSSTKDAAWTSLSAEQKRGIQLALLYGFPCSNNGGSAADSYMATQALIWEFQTGVRESTKTNKRKTVKYSFVDGGKKYTVDVASNYFYNILTISDGGKKAYDTLVEKIYAHDVMPDFGLSKTTIELPYDASSKKYTITLTDKNKVLSKFDITPGSGVTATVSGNNLTLTATKKVSNVNLTFSKKDQKTVYPAQLIFTSTSAGQTTIMGQSQVDASTVYKVNSIIGSLQITKVDDKTDKPLPGAKISLFDSQNNLVNTVVTDANGVATFTDLPAGDYVAMESEAPGGYKLSDEKFSFKIETNGQTIKHTLKNGLVYRKIGVYKIGEMLTGFSDETISGYPCKRPVYEEKYLSDCVVNIYSASDIVTADGTTRYKADELVDTITTSKEGPVYSKDLPEGDYYLVENEAPNGYRLAEDNQPINLFGENKLVSFQDERIKCEVKFKKSMNNTTGEAMSNYYNLVSFGVFSGEEINDLPADTLLDVIVPDENGDCQMTVDLPFGHKYYVKELGTADGFKLDTNIYDFNFDDVGENTEIFHATIGNMDVVINEMIPVETERKVMGESENTTVDIERSTEVLAETDRVGDEAVSILVVGALFIGSMTASVAHKKKLTSTR